MFLDLLVRRITNNEEIINQALSLKTDRERLSLLIQNGFSKEEVIDKLEAYFSVTYIDLGKVEISEDVCKKLNVEKLKSGNIIPFHINEDSKEFFFAGYYLPTNKEVKKIEERIKDLGMKPVFMFAFDFEIQRKYVEIEEREREKEPENVEIINKDSEEKVGIGKWIANIINYGIERNASDIHLEPKEDRVQVRYRIDGILTNIKNYAFDDAELSKLMVRIKTLSGMKIEEKRKPQDGRIGNHIYNDKIYDLRISVISTISGEKIVMRIVDKSAGIVPFEDIGFYDDEILNIKKALDSPNGIIYIGGATGSGKTTTLYTMIDYKDKDEINIYSIEDPVEKEIPTINQIQVNEGAGVTYPVVLKSLLRQDPDVMVIGEVRDTETAELALSASLAGHLVLTTVHANNALDTLNRLYGMGLQPYLVGTTSLLIMSQRLMRKLCPHCKEKTNIKKHEKIWINKIIEEEGFDDDILDNVDFYKPVGCDNCIDGYSGRFAVAEMLVIDEELQGLISEKAEMEEIEKVARNKGFKKLGYSALKKILEGETSIEEAIKVIC